MKALLFGVLLAVVFPVLSMLQGCRPAQAPDAYRAGISLVSEAVRVTDGACANLALERHDQNLALSCAAAYDTARNSLLAAEAGLDAGHETNALCAFKNGVNALHRLADAVSSAGGSLPPVVADAFSFGEPIAALCRAP